MSAFLPLCALLALFAVPIALACASDWLWHVIEERADRE